MTFSSLLGVISISGWLSLWEFVEYASEAAVGLGCLGEYIAEYTNWRTEEKRRVLGRRSLLILILGIGVGIVSLIQTNALSSKAIESLGKQAAQAGEIAKLASETSDSALVKAKSAETLAEKSEGMASNALILARGARQEADLFKNEIASARKQAAEAESHLAEVVKRAKDIERRIAWRTLSLGQRQRVAEKLRPFSGQKFSIIELPDDLEIEGIGDDILTTLIGPNGASWNRLALQRIPDPQRRLVSGVFVDVRRDADQRSIKAASALSLALNKEGIKTSPPHPESGSWSVLGGVFNSRTGSFQDLIDSPILLVIGKKPRPE